MNSLTARKNVEDLQQDGEGQEQLHRTLGPVQLVALGIGAVIGAGIFVLTGEVAAHYAGPAIVLSFLIGAVACALAGLCYAEFASLIPIAGSAYTYAYATLGELVAWMIGWDLILEYALGTATVAAGWSGYVVSFLHGFGVALPPALTAAPGVNGVGVFNLPAFIGVLGIVGLLVVGVVSWRTSTPPLSASNWPSSRRFWASARCTCTRPTGTRSCRRTQGSLGSSGGAAFCAARV